MTWFGATMRERQDRPRPEGVPATGDVVALRLVPGRLYAVARQPDGYRVALAAAGDGASLEACAVSISAALGLVPGAADCWTLPS